MTIQLADDFLSGSLLMDQSLLTQEEKDARQEVLSSLKIDCILRRADYSRFYQDLEQAVPDYKEVIDLCMKYPAGNERTVTSAYFSVGSILLDQGKRDEAKE